MIRHRLGRLARVTWILLFCSLALLGCQPGWNKYTIEEVSQALYDADLIFSQDLQLVEYPGGIQEYPLRSDMLTLPGRYAGRIVLYPTRSERERVRRGVAESMAKGPFTYSEFVQGNVVITIRPELSPEDEERFRRALDCLE
jgi:hypothetical protein